MNIIAFIIYLLYLLFALVLLSKIHNKFVEREKHDCRNCKHCVMITDAGYKYRVRCDKSFFDEELDYSKINHCGLFERKEEKDK